MQRIEPVSVDRLGYAGFGAFVLALMVGLHVVGYAMGAMFEFRIGFRPIWFLDCTGCLPRGWSVPYGWPIVGGLSVALVVAGVAVAWNAVGKRRGLSGRTHRVLAAVSAVALGAFAIGAFVYRYPGSLPSVLIAVLPAAVGAVALAIGATGTVGDAMIGPIAPPPLTLRSRIAVGAGLISLVGLGGLMSVVATAAGALAWEDSNDARNHRAAGLAVGLGIASGILRWSLVGRYPWLGVLG